jgi:hypothetical protein
MHPLEGIIIIAAGTIAWLIGSGRFASDTRTRTQLEVRLPRVKNRNPMYGIAALLSAFGLLVLSGFVK